MLVQVIHQSRSEKSRSGRGRENRSLLAVISVDGGAQLRVAAFLGQSYTDLYEHYSFA